MLFPRGVLAFWGGIIVIFAHFFSLLIISSNSTISWSSKSDLYAIMLPITVASITSAVVYFLKHALIDPKNTPKTNAGYFLVTILLPAAAFVILGWKLYQLDGEPSVDNFKVFVVGFEAFFGVILAMTNESLFSSPVKPPKVPDD